MLSLCIPIYNYDVRATVRRLAAQAARLDVPVEIVCIDDASSEPFRTLNSELGDVAKLICLERNVGRSRIRNLFLEHTAQPYMLFLDCDSLIVDDGFLQRYVEVLLREGGSVSLVVCGGRIYPPAADRRHRLRHRYGVERECRDAAQRRMRPYASFMTNNFVVPREVLRAIPFDESLSRYGHEDTLFGIRLAQRQVPIAHIDNPVLNGDVEENGEFLRKTREGVENLVDIYLSAGLEREFEQQVALVSFYKTLKSKGLLPVVRAVGRLAVPPMEWCLKCGIVSVKVFNFYKLCLFAQRMGRDNGSVQKKT
ncbi:MAG: glycosyltransferase family 2 protein [Bacteroidales bacterium]|nr:glycosyltransferase family 2 protein [Bacteroidales bacterium]